MIMRGNGPRVVRSVVVSFFILIFAGSIFILGSSNLKAQVEAWPSPVRIIYLPSIGKESTLARFKPLSRHLEKVLGAPVESVSFDSYEEMIANLSKGEFEIAYLSPSTYVESGRIAKLEPVPWSWTVSGTAATTA